MEDRKNRRMDLACWSVCTQSPNAASPDWLQLFLPVFETTQLCLRWLSPLKWTQPISKSVTAWSCLRNLMSKTVKHVSLHEDRLSREFVAVYTSTYLSAVLPLRRLVRSTNRISLLEVIEDILRVAVVSVLTRLVGVFVLSTGRESNISQKLHHFRAGTHTKEPNKMFLFAHACTPGLSSVDFQTAHQRLLSNKIWGKIHPITIASSDAVVIWTKAQTCMYI